MVSPEVRLLFFAKSREIVGRKEAELEVPQEEGKGRRMGTDYVDVTEDRLSVEDITERATSPTSGAIGLFVGTTRNNFEGKTVLRLEYEAYMPMAKKKMLETCELVRDKWNVENIVMVHRIG
nr:hypothetical protein BaRGS_033000 [Batillaria attramentaria]